VLRHGQQELEVAQLEAVTKAGFPIHGRLTKSYQGIR
jgi:hypothetical protein